MRVFVMVLIVLLTAAVSQELRGFAGTWAIDPAKVHESAAPAKTPPKDAPETPPPPPSKHEYTLEVIRQSGDLLKISGGQAGTTAVYTIDRGESAKLCKPRRFKAAARYRGFAISMQKALAGIAARKPR